MRQDPENEWKLLPKTSWLLIHRAMMYMQPYLCHGVGDLWLLQVLYVRTGMFNRVTAILDERDFMEENPKHLQGKSFLSTGTLYRELGRLKENGVVLQEKLIRYEQFGTARQRYEYAINLPAIVAAYLKQLIYFGHVPKSLIKTYFSIYNELTDYLLTQEFELPNKLVFEHQPEGEAAYPGDVYDMEKEFERNPQIRRKKLKAYRIPRAVKKKPPEHSVLYLDTWTEEPKHAVDG